MKAFLSKFSPPLSPSQIDEIVQRHEQILAEKIAELKRRTIRIEQVIETPKIIKR